MADLSDLADEHVVLSVVVSIHKLVAFHDGSLPHVVLIFPRLVEFVFPEKFLLVVFQLSHFSF